LVEFGEEWKDGKSTKILQIDEQSTSFLLWLTYNGNLVDNVSYNRPDKVLQRTQWVRTLVKSIDPDYTALEHWITGKTNGRRETKKLGPDFESGISILFCLCGLNSVHVGNAYEQATQKWKFMLQPSRVKLPIDVFAWSSLQHDDIEVLYLAQCVLGGSSADLMNKINDVAFAATMVDNMLSDHF
jgi:hypothetical protein